MREQHPKAGQIVKLRPGTHLIYATPRRVDLVDMGGEEYRIQDWGERIVAQISDPDTNPAVVGYRNRVIHLGLPTDEEVVYGKTTDGISHFVHVTEIEDGGEA